MITLPAPFKLELPYVNPICTPTYGMTKYWMNTTKNTNFYEITGWGRLNNTFPPGDFNYGHYSSSP